MWLKLSFYYAAHTPSRQPLPSPTPPLYYLSRFTKVSPLRHQSVNDGSAGKTLGFGKPIGQRPIPNAHGSAKGGTGTKHFNDVGLGFCGGCSFFSSFHAAKGKALSCLCKLFLKIISE